MLENKINFEIIPIWNNSKPEESFKILSDEINGRIPTTRIEHWSKYSEVIDNSFFNTDNIELIFRGQRRFDWQLSPSLARLSENGIISNELSSKQLEIFKKAVRGRIPDHSLLTDDSSAVDELWSIGQHHGLMTPLLDWTYSPYVALFFAFSKEDQEDELNNPYRAVYILNKTIISKYTEEQDDSIRFFEPKKDDYGRLVSQAGLFTFSPTNSTIENKLTDIITSDDFQENDIKIATETEEDSIIAKYISKIYIRNEDQQACIKHLRRMNVHHGSLFPDLMGASEYCNIKITEIQRKTQLTDEINDESKPAYFITDIKNNETETPKTDKQTFNSIKELLQHPKEGKDLNNKAIETITTVLSKAISTSTLIDWKERDQLKSEIRNKTRVLLRKYNYPETARNYIVDNIIETLSKQEKELE